MRLSAPSPAKSAAGAIINWISAALWLCVCVCVCVCVCMCVYVCDLRPQCGHSMRSSGSSGPESICRYATDKWPLRRVTVDVTVTGSAET